MNLINALRTSDSVTENGMATNSSSLNFCVDLFFQIGAMRGKDKQRLINAFVKAYNEDALTAIRLLFWARDVRGGAGERQIFKDLIKYLAENHSDVVNKNLHLIPEFGRWDDLLVLFNSEVEQSMLSLIAKGLDDKNQLCAKWLPRPNSNDFVTKQQVNKIRKYLNLTPKEYRKLIVGLSNTVEQLMCSNKWDNIDYSKLPSKAMSNLMKAFGKNDTERFVAYLKSLEKGETKINAGAIYPYDVVKNLKSGNSQGANLQWNALPNYMENSNERILPLVDVSGSMETPAGNNKAVTCMDVAISLGLYISERNVGDFKDAFITFHSNPELLVLKGTLNERYSQMARSTWGTTTDLHAAFKLILNQAVKHNVEQKDMPTMLLILSDMEFNQAIRGGYNLTAQNMIEQMYSKAGYIMPKIVYWNIRSRSDSNKPVSFDTNGTALVSGFSPSLLTNLLAGKDMTPYSMMMTVVNSDRYKEITV